MRLVVDFDDLLDLPLVALVLVPVPHDAGQGRADEAVRAVRVVVEADLQRDQAVLAEVDALRDLPCSKSQKWTCWPYLPAFTSSSLKPGMKVFGAAHSLS